MSLCALLLSPSSSWNLVEPWRAPTKEPRDLTPDYPCSVARGLALSGREDGVTASCGPIAPRHGATTATTTRGGGSRWRRRGCLLHARSLCTTCSCARLPRRGAAPCCIYVYVYSSTRAPSFCDREELAATPVKKGEETRLLLPMWLRMPNFRAHNPVGQPDTGLL